MEFIKVEETVYLGSNILQITVMYEDLEDDDLPQKAIVFYLDMITGNTIEEQDLPM